MDATKGLVELIKEEMLRQNREAGRMEGLEEGREEGREEVIKQLLRKGFPLEEIGQLLEIPMAELAEIQKKLQ